MSDFSPILEQLQRFVEQRVPPDMLSKAIPAALVFLVAGVALSVFGAKLARIGMGAAFVALGAVAGTYFGNAFSYSALGCALVGAVMFGTIGHMTFRLWVGVATGVVLSLLAMGVFGYHRVVPHVAAFESSQGSMVTWSPMDGPTEFAVPSPEQQQTYLNRSPREWVKRLWAYVTSQDAQVERQGSALALVALLSGLCLGVVAVRWTLILTTSLLGTALVTTAVASLFAHTMGESYQAFGKTPGMVGVGVGGFLATSLIVQTLLTRKAPSPEPATKS